MASVLCLSVSDEATANVFLTAARSETGLATAAAQISSAGGATSSTIAPPSPAAARAATSSTVSHCTGSFAESLVTASQSGGYPVRPPRPPPITPQRRNRPARIEPCPRVEAASSGQVTAAATSPAAVHGTGARHLTGACDDGFSADSVPPPYSTLPSAQSSALTGDAACAPMSRRCLPAGLPGGRLPDPLPPNGVGGATCFADHYSLIGIARGRRGMYESRGRIRRSGGAVRSRESRQKSCCGGGEMGGCPPCCCPPCCCGLLLLSQTVSVRWFILVIGLVGLSCSVVGTVLGTLRSSGRQHLTVSLLMIGVGVLLMTVAAVAWRLTAGEAPTCRQMLGLTRSDMHLEEGGPRLAPSEVVGAVLTSSGRRFAQRMVPGYGRPHHPYAAMVYPEYQFRPPPPSYHASMQAYRLGLLLDRPAAPGAAPRPNGAAPAAPPSQCAAFPLSPPPVYRSDRPDLDRQQTLSVLSERSQPPSYHSRQSSALTMPDRHEASRESVMYGSPLDGSATGGVVTGSAAVSSALDGAHILTPQSGVGTSATASANGNVSDTFGPIKSLRRKRRHNKAPPQPPQCPQQQQSLSIPVPAGCDVSSCQVHVSAGAPLQSAVATVTCSGVTVTAAPPQSVPPAAPAGSGDVCLVSVVRTESPSVLSLDPLALSVDAACREASASPVVTEASPKQLSERKAVTEGGLPVASSEVQILAHL